METTRRYDLDWLRLIAILILLFFHAGMWFNTWGWHVKNSETTTSFQYWMIWSHHFRMPLLLFISGAGTYMALGKRTPQQFVGERFRRLFIPLVFGMFVIVPPQIYYEHIADYASYGEFYKTVFDFVPYPKGSLSWHHLWFIIYLLVYSLLVLPLLIFLRKESSAAFKKRISDLLSHPAILLLGPASVILVSQIILRPYFPQQTHALINDWSYFTQYFLYVVFGILLYASGHLWENIGGLRRYLAVATTISIIPFYICYFHFRKHLTLPWSDDTVEVMFEVAAIYVSWFTVITIIAYGQHYLNRPHPWLSHLNESLYPFYILHQTVIIVIGYYVCQWDWSIAAKYWTICFLTLVSCVGLYVLVIRPFRLMRILFGMKAKPSSKA